VLSEHPTEEQQEQQQQQQDEDEDENKEQNKELTVVGTFNEFMYWKRESAPQNNDPVLLSLTSQWLDISNSIHTDITRDQILASQQSKLDKLSRTTVT